MKKGLSQLLLLLLLVVPAPAQERPGAAHRPDPHQVFSELLRPYRSLIDYTVTIEAKVNMPAIRVPDFTATLYFKKPDKFHIETKSFAPIPRNSGVFNPFQFDPEKNQVTYQRTENLDGVQADVYRVDPRGGETRIRNYQVWIGGTPRRILQAESLSLWGTKGVVTLTYRMVEQGAERWLLPEKVRVHFTFPEGAQSPDASLFSTKDSPVSSGMRRLDEISGEGEVAMTYREWRINTGLDDGLFTKNNR